MTHAAHRAPPAPPHESIASTTRRRRRPTSAERRIAAHDGTIGGAQVTSPTNPAAQGDDRLQRARRLHDSRGPVTTG